MQVGKNIRLFKNDFVEQCSYVHPVMPILLWGPIIGWLFGHETLTHNLGVTETFGLAFAGGLVWTASEYMLHRWIFHFKPNGPLQARFAYIIHGIHHDDPEDERRLLMPPAAGIAIAVPFFIFFQGLLGTVLVKPFFAGFLIGYLCYDYTHFAVHWWNPKSKWFKRLKHNHMRHHFVCQDKRYGVSGMFWDRVFGTSE